MRETTNRGAIRLGKACSKRNAKKQLADEMGREPSTVSRWCSGELVPKTADRMFLENRFGIGWQLWDQKVPRPSVAKEVSRS